MFLSQLLYVWSIANIVEELNIKRTSSLTQSNAVQQSQMSLVILHHTQAFSLKIALASRTSSHV